MEVEIKLKQAQSVMLFLAMTRHGQQVKKKFFQQEMMRRYNTPSTFGGVVDKLEESKRGEMKRHSLFGDLSPLTASESMSPDVVP